VIPIALSGRINNNEPMALWIRLFFLILTVGSLSAEVQNGVLDLSHWDGRRTISLDGEWHFSPRALSEQGSSELSVPGVWDKANKSANGWGTYSLTILFSDTPPRDFALSVPAVNSAADIFWNQDKVLSIGRFGQTPELTVPQRKTDVVSLEPQPGKNLLEIHVANWGDLNGGLTESFHVGTLKKLLSERSSGITLSVFLFGCLFVMGIYHWGLFGHRPSDRSPLWFGFVSILLGVRGLVFGPIYLADLAPWLDWQTMMKLMYLTFSATALFFVLFIRDVFPKSTPRWFIPAGLLGAGLYSLMNLFLPVAFYSPFLHPFQLYVGAMGIVVIVILVLAILHKEPGSILFLVGFLLFFATIVNDILKTNFFIPTPYLSPMGLVIFLVFQSLVMIKKFTEAFADSERYSRHLVRLNSSLERFIPREVLSFLQKKSIVEIELGDHCEQPMSVMFADIRDFTTLSESMTPEQNFKFINSYLRRMGPVVRRHGGFVDKYLGDGIMALFPGEAHHAVDASLALRVALEEYNLHRSRSGYATIRMGIGIHRGVLMLGTIGENQRMDSTVISDTVNAASRLEGLTKKFARNILISGETMEAMGLEQSSEYQVEYLGEETVKGRTKPLKVYALEVSQTA